MPQGWCDGHCRSERCIFAFMEVFRCCNRSRPDRVRVHDADRPQVTMRSLKKSYRRSGQILPIIIGLDTMTFTLNLQPPRPGFS